MPVRCNADILHYSCSRQREVAAGYAAVKRRPAIRFQEDRHGYTTAKAPFMWAVIR